MRLRIFFNKFDEHNIEFVDDCESFQFFDRVFQVIHKDESVECFPLMNIESIIFPYEAKKK